MLTGRRPVAYVDIGCRCALAVVFAVSAWSKLRGPAAFAAFSRSVRRLGVLSSAGSARAAAVGIAAAEVAVPVLVAPDRTASIVAGYVLAAAMLSAFTVGIALSLRRGDRTPCGCFGRSAVPLGGRHIVHNLVLLAVAAAGLAATGSGGAVGEARIGFVAAAAGLVVGGLVIVGDDLAELFSPSTRHRPQG